MNIYAIKKPKRINFVSVTVTLVALVVGYLGWFAIPVWWPSFQMGGIMRGACNDAYRILDDQKVLKKLIKDSLRTGLKVTHENFRFTRIPYTPADLLEHKVPSDSYIAQRGKACVIEFYYAADYAWPLIDKTQHIVFEKRVEEPLLQIKY